MTSLAPWTYRKLFEPGNAVLARLSCREIPFDPTVGEPGGFEAYADLRPEHRARAGSTPVLYGKADGTGYARTATTACHRAISEALERWCFYETAESPRAAESGFALEPTTTGMAAFPGFGSGPARDRALCEAIERWTIAAWWEGRLGASSLASAEATQVARIHHPWRQSGLEVVLRVEDAGGRRVYGFACARDMGRAIRQARAEARRNREALRRLEAPETPTDALPLFERRLVFFSSPGGRALFDRRWSESMSDAECAARPPTPPRKLVDREITGPWSRYARVHRVLFQMPSTRHLGEAESYFQF